MPSPRKSRALPQVLVAGVSLALWFASGAPGWSATPRAGLGPATTEASFEERVLQVIRNNPAVVLEALDRLEQQKEQEQRQKQAALLKELFPNPARIIGASPVKGDGEILLVEFSDFQCPYCAQAHRTLNSLLAQQGKSLKVAYKHFPLSQIHSQALPAARAAWAAGQQGKFWAYHDALFENQAKFSEAFFEETAKTLGLNLQQFARDRRGEASLRAIQQDLALAERLQLQGTPTFLMQRGGTLELLSLPDLQAQFPQRAQTP